ncbi:MAG: HD domain-containing protein [Prevotellaceae bacterium]|jgi:uncharacterized protein|nr:HD domain-containing protein [Prevotellaceae bacterium]
MNIIPELKSYIEQNILPRYDVLDSGHNVNHIQKVIDDSLTLAQQFDVNINMVYVIAAYHDIGIEKSRDLHHIISGEILVSDENLKKWFSQQQLEIMRQAVEDHRASNKYEPRSIYGKIVAEADRDISLHTILRRTIQFGLKNNSTNDFELQFERAYRHLVNKYGENGYLKLYLHSAKNEKGLAEVRSAINDKETLRNICKKIFDEETL